MTPVYQTVIDNERGDCERACVATITGIPIEEIPNFSEPGLPLDCWMNQWLHTRGYGLIETYDKVKYNWIGLYRLVAIATVPSQMFEGCRHAIVVGWRDHPVYPGAYECYVFHDPNPNNAPYKDVDKQIERLRWIVPHAL